jgi:hypothetical protein
MREWSLAPGAPLALNLAADFRLCTTDTLDDQNWELEIGSGDPPALALCTTYGLRARLMRLFPSFSMGGQSVSNPAGFTRPPRLRRFYPNFLLLDLSPFPGVEVVAEYWAPDPHAVAGRFTVTNRIGATLSLLLELCGQLVPLEGQSLAPASMHSVNVLTGQTSGLAPVVFLTGGPQTGPAPYPSLAMDLSLAPGSSRCLTWVQAALASASDSFEFARRIASRSWDAERARIELVNAAQTVEIRTGDPDWDAALALSQKAAFGLFFSPSQSLPSPSFVLSRLPDHGYSPRRDGRDYSSHWNGQSPLDGITISGLLPGAPELAAGLVRNFLVGQAQDGGVDSSPDLAGQRENWLAAPLLASLACWSYHRTLDKKFLHEVQAGLNAFFRNWFTESHDRDQDGFPEWDHPLQTGLEDNPAFTLWQAGGQGAGIEFVESPSLLAMLYREALSLAQIAEVLGQSKEAKRMKVRAEELRLLTGQCWDASAGLYHNRDRASHRCPAGKTLGRPRRAGQLAMNHAFRQPERLLVRIKVKGDATPSPEVVLHGLDGEKPQTEQLVREDFQWGAGLGVAPSRNLYTRLEMVEVAGLGTRDLVSLQVMDLSEEDISLFLPLWAGIPDLAQAGSMLRQALLAPDRFGRPFGIPACIQPAPPGGPVEPDVAASSTCQAVHLPWNALIGEGLLAYGFRDEAARLVTQLMSAVIQDLKKQHTFHRAYHSVTGVGIGGRNALQGLAPVGLFLDTLGVRLHSQRRITLSGKNPFPWPVTVKYRNLTVIRQADQTQVVFPDGQMLTLNDPTEAVVSAD